MILSRSVQGAAFSRMPTPSYPENSGQFPAPKQMQNSPYLSAVQRRNSKTEDKDLWSGCSYTQEIVCNWGGEEGRRSMAFYAMKSEKAPQVGKGMATRKEARKRGGDTAIKLHRQADEGSSSLRQDKGQNLGHCPFAREASLNSVWPTGCP